MNLNELKDKAYQCAISHGWHEEKHSDEHWLCLVISELMEAVQADRNGKRADVAMFKEWQGNSLPITGRDIEEVEAECIFAKEILQKKGFITVYPLDASCNHDAPYSEHMGKDITALLECDGVVLLKD